MKKHVIILGVSLMLLSVYVSGCDKLLRSNPDHVTVNIMVAVYITMLDAQNHVVNATTDGMEVVIGITRDGADWNPFTRIMQNGLCQATGVMELSKGQYFEVNATVPHQFREYRMITPGYAKLTWDTVNASDIYGDIYNWYPHVTITMKQQS